MGKKLNVGDALEHTLAGYEERAKKLLSKKPHLEGHIDGILTQIRKIRFYIANNYALPISATTRLIYFNTTSLMRKLYDTGLSKPDFMLWGSRKGGKADKRPKGIILAMEKVLSTKKRTLGPLWLWKIFERGHDVPADGYDIVYSKDSTGLKEGDSLVQEDIMSGKKKSIKFKTFEKYYYEILKAKPDLKDH